MKGLDLERLRAYLDSKRELTGSMFAGGRSNLTYAITDGDELFQHLCEVALDEWLQAAEQGLAYDDPWEGFAHYFNAGIDFGPGSLAPLAGTIEVTPRMAAKSQRSDEAIDALVARARAAGVLRQDVTPVDLALLIEQLSKSPLLEQLHSQGRHDLDEAAMNAQRRLAAIALDGLRPPSSGPLPGSAPSERLITERWEH